MSTQLYTLLILYTFCYSVLGWAIETVVCSITERKFVNRGFLYGPYCPIYGFGAILILASTQMFRAYPPLVFLAAMVLTSALEYFTSWVMELLFQIRWWDYSDKRFNIHGRVCLENAIAFGGLGLLMTYVLQPWLRGVIGVIDLEGQRALASLITVVFMTDMAFTLNTLLKLRERLNAVQAQVRDWATETQGQLRERLEADGERFRHVRNFPHLRVKKQAAQPWTKPGAYKLFWVFVAAGVLGFVIETVYCFALSGEITSRQGLLYGPFNQIYGVGAVLMTLLLGRLSEQSDRWLFIGSALIGGTFEYCCSLVQEKAFHSVSWEYSEQVMSVGGRTSLMYMLFWGILGVVFIRDIYPFLSRMIDRIPRRQGNFFTAVLAVLLIADMLVSGFAVVRWREREQGIPAQTAIGVYMDREYPDEAMKAVYPGMVWTE